MIADDSCTLKHVAKHHVARKWSTVSLELEARDFVLNWHSRPRLRWKTIVRASACLNSSLSLNNDGYVGIEILEVHVLCSDKRLRALARQLSCQRYRIALKEPSNTTAPPIELTGGSLPIPAYEFIKTIRPLLTPIIHATRKRACINRKQGSVIVEQRRVRGSPKS